MDTKTTFRHQQVRFHVIEVALERNASDAKNITLFTFKIQILPELPSEVGLKAPVGYEVVDEYEVGRRQKIKELEARTIAKDYIMPPFVRKSDKYDLCKQMFLRMAVESCSPVQATKRLGRC